MRRLAMLSFMLFLCAGTAKAQNAVGLAPVRQQVDVDAGCGVRLELSGAGLPNNGRNTYIKLYRHAENAPDGREVLVSDYLNVANNGAPLTLTFRPSAVRMIYSWEAYYGTRAGGQQLKREFVVSLGPGSATDEVLYAYDALGGAVFSHLRVKFTRC